MLSFSKRGDDFRLWDEYADNGRGICYVFDTYKLSKLHSEESFGESSINDDYYVPVPVYYSEDRMYGIKLIENIERIIKFTFFTKLPEYEFEQEYRCLSLDINGTRPFNPKSLVGIIYGENITQEYKSKIQPLLQEYQIKHNLKLAEFYIQKLDNELVICSF